ncbi:MAG: hypothetical protein R3264_22935, partial [Anaerolineae bacterium]|nr:hypothetical protein [Anaerolineae bacterium]
MRHIFWIILLIISIGLLGCAPGEGAQVEPTKVRLSLETWPTPAPTATPITPTPFPKVTVEAAATIVPPTPKPANTPQAAEADGGQGNTNLDISLGGVNISEIVLQQANRLISERFPPIGVGFTTVDNAALLA